MAMASGKACCVICGKGKAALKCAGCSQDFCFNHIADHRRELDKQLDEIEVNRDVFRQTLTDQSTDPKKHVLIKQIDQWERESINKVRQAADEAKQLVLKNTTEHIAQIEVRLEKLTEQLRQGREENDFFETDLNQWTGELKRLTEELDQPSNMKLHEDSTPFVSKIYVNVTSKRLRSTNMGINTKWIQNGNTVAGGSGNGERSNQVNNPFGIYVDDNDAIYIADSGNNRIMEWKNGASYGQVVAGGNGRGNRIDQLNGPKDVIIDKMGDCLLICDENSKRVVRWSRRRGTIGHIVISNIDCWGLAKDKDGHLYVSDCKKNEVRCFRMGDTSGEIVAGGNGAGNRLDQLNYPNYLFVDHEYSVWVSDRNNHRVVKWRKGAREGVVVAGGRGEGNGLTQLSTPRGIIVDHLGTVYVADDDNHRVMRWLKEATQGAVVVGGNGKGAQPNQLSGPTGLSVDRQGNLYVVDWDNYRVQRFNIDLSSNT